MLQHQRKGSRYKASNNVDHPAESAQPNQDLGVIEPHTVPTTSSHVSSTFAKQQKHGIRVMAAPLQHLQPSTKFVNQQPILSTSDRSSRKTDPKQLTASKDEPPSRKASNQPPIEIFLFSGGAYHDASQHGAHQTDLKLQQRTTELRCSAADSIRKTEEHDKDDPTTSAVFV